MKWPILSGPSIAFAAVMATSIMPGQAEEYEPAPPIEAEEAAGDAENGLLDKALDWMTSGPEIAEVGTEQTRADAVEEPVEPENAAAPGQIQAVPTATTGSIDPDAVQVVGEGMELHIQDLEIASALQLLSLQAQRNIVVSKEVGGTISANLYNVTFYEALHALLTANGFAYREKGGFIYVYTAEELAALEQLESVPFTRVYKFSYLSATDASILIKPALSGIGQVAISPPAQIGISSGTGDTGGDSDSGMNTMVVYDYEENLAGIEQILAEIDVRPQQVLVEATILQATLDEDNALGIDFNVLAGIDFRDMGSVSDGGNNIRTGTVTGDDLASEFGTFNTDFAGDIPNGGLSIGVITNNAAVFVRALEQITDTTVLANPKVLALNKQRGEVHVGRRDGYITTTVTETTATQTVEFLDTGTQLLFRPFIGNDGYIRLEIHPEDSNGGLTIDNLPFEVTTTVTSNIMVKDGHTVVIGGLFRERTTTTRGQIPLLGDIPFAGALFRSSRDTTVREEVIILITPHIIKDYEIESNLADAELERIRDLTVGLRDGLQPFGRERLAQTYYKRAFHFSEEGNIEKAIWNAQMAVEMLPMFLDAINLRDRLMNRRNWEADTGMMRTMIFDIVRSERMAEGKTPRPIPSWYPRKANVSAAGASAQAQPLPVLSMPDDFQNKFAGAESPADFESELDAGPDPSVEDIEAALDEFDASQEEYVPSAEEELDAAPEQFLGESEPTEDEFVEPAIDEFDDVPAIDVAPEPPQFEKEDGETGFEQIDELDYGITPEFLEDIGREQKPIDRQGFESPTMIFADVEDGGLDEVVPDDGTFDGQDFNDEYLDDIGFQLEFLEDIGGDDNAPINDSEPAVPTTSDVEDVQQSFESTSMPDFAGVEEGGSDEVAQQDGESEDTEVAQSEQGEDGESGEGEAEAVAVEEQERDEDSELLYADPTVDESDVE